MKRLRLLLFPLGLCYGAVSALRNFFYDSGILKTFKIPAKSITVGNLSTGGTGKTPLVDYILEHFSKLEYRVTALSRGYGRATRGVIVADQNTTSQEIGDEPQLYKFRHRDSINVVVAEKRKQGVELILNRFPKNELIVLDDAFQHRAVTAGLSILTTTFSDLYTNDHILPVGNLREYNSGAQRADMIVVTKCPSEMNAEEMNRIKKKLNFDTDSIFFSSIEYTDLVPFQSRKDDKKQHILLVTGIANPKPLIDHLSKIGQVTHLKFSDHHDFSSADIDEIHDKFGTFATHDKIVVTTEKDFMRLKNFNAVINTSVPWYYQPIAIKMYQETQFKKRLEEYVAKF
ncbi:tetraacyldisaccharide 4'-kinase [Crocinitomicaceae bacterium]|nr:tetraacyldisaccharide 4'-kinase [Crocinitomicaceae bacterium]